MQEVTVVFQPATVHAALLAVPFSDAFAGDIASAVQRSGLLDAMSSLLLSAAAADESSTHDHHQHSSGQELVAAAALIERTGAAFACCAWIYVAVIEPPGA